MSAAEGKRTSKHRVVFEARQRREAVSGTYRAPEGGR